MFIYVFYLISNVNFFWLEDTKTEKYLFENIIGKVSSRAFVKMKICR